MLLLSYLKVFLCKQCDTLNSQMWSICCFAHAALFKVWCWRLKKCPLYGKWALAEKGHLVARKEGIIIMTQYKIKSTFQSHQTGKMKSPQTVPKGFQVVWIENHQKHSIIKINDLSCNLGAQKSPKITQKYPLYGKWAFAEKGHYHNNKRTLSDVSGCPKLYKVWCWRLKKCPLYGKKALAENDLLVARKEGIIIIKNEPCWI